MQTLHNPQVSAHRSLSWLGVALTPLLALSGCATNTQTGALLGGATGAGVGAALGRAAGNTGAGAIIGAGVGTLVGAAAGESADRAEHRQAVAQDVAARGGPMSLEQIRDMAHNNVGDALIINQIRLTRTVYQLNADQVIWLKNEGVSSAVIDAMQMTGYPPNRVIVVEQAPPPVIGVGFGYGYGYRRRW